MDKITTTLVIINQAEQASGVIPLEALGIELDLKNQTIKLLPISATETYLTIL